MEILTFDFVGNRAAEQVERIIKVFEKYGMHGIFTIWSNNMEENDSSQCKDDACWQAFRDAYNSGTVTLGSHSINHLDFREYSEKYGLWEFAESKSIIEEKIGNGCIVEILNWPFESIPDWYQSIEEIGYKAAFGGNTYDLYDNSVKNK